MTDNASLAIAKIRNRSIRLLLEVGNVYGRELHLLYVDSSILQLAEYISELEEKCREKEGL